MRNKTTMTAMPRSVGQLFLGRYQAVELLGEGGMGRVYRGRDTGTGRHVAIKVMHQEIAAQPRFRQRFEREMRLMAQFSHPHAVALLDASADAPRPCLVMEFVPGIALEDLIQRDGPLAPERVGRLLQQLCWVLDGAHGAGILHRDISCANLLILDAGTPAEQLKVMDFGLAQLGARPYIALEKLTGSGHSVGAGTPDYLSPEQIQGQAVDQRADLYSVGVVLFKMLTGHLPFEHATETHEILLAHAEEDPPTFAMVNPAISIPATVEAIVRECLAKGPHERPASAHELAERFQAALGQPFVEWESVVSLPAAAAQRDTEIDLAAVLDQMEAWMPEQIAVVKLRGFVHDLGGEVLESVPGLIRMILPAPAAAPAPPPKRRWPFGSRPKPPEPRFILLDLHIDKMKADQNHLQVTVVLNPDQDKLADEDGEQRAFYEQLCRTLRSYLMSR
jgi:serine/threonine-protein kinase